MSMSSSQSYREYTGCCASWVRYSLHEGERAPGNRGAPTVRGYGDLLQDLGFVGWIRGGVSQQGFALGWVVSERGQSYDGYFSECSLQESQLAQRARRMVKKWSLLAAGGGDVCQAFVGVVREPCFLSA